MPGPRVYGGHSGGGSAAGGTCPPPTQRQKAKHRRPEARPPTRPAAPPAPPRGGKGRTSSVRKAVPHPALRCRLPPKGEGIVIHADTAEAHRRGFSFRGADPAA